MSSSSFVSSLSLRTAIIRKAWVVGPPRGSHVKRLERLVGKCELNPKKRLLTLLELY